MGLHKWGGGGLGEEQIAVRPEATAIFACTEKSIVIQSQVLRSHDQDIELNDVTDL